MQFYAAGRIGIYRNRIDLVELGDKLGEAAIVILVSFKRKQAMESRAKDVQITLSKKAYCDNTLFRHHSSPGIDEGNGRPPNKCLFERLIQTTPYGSAGWLNLGWDSPEQQLSTRSNFYWHEQRFWLNRTNIRLSPKPGIAAAETPSAPDPQVPQRSSSLMRQLE